MSAESPMLAAERQERLVAELERRGRINAAGAASALGTSAETIRKDLIALERRGRLRRVHGGALPLHPMTFEPDMDSRGDEQDEKNRIGALAATLAPELGAILIDAGSTTLALADRFPNRRLIVHTNALPIASALISLEMISVWTIAGRVRPRTQAAVGAAAAAAIERLRFDILFAGTNGASLESGLSTPDPEEAEIKARMIASAERVVLLADHTKFERRSLVRYADLRDVDVVVTGEELASERRRELAEAGLEVLTA